MKVPAAAPSELAIGPFATRTFMMSKLVVAEFLSLDGVTQDPAWTGPYWNDELARVKQAELFASDSWRRRRRATAWFVLTYDITDAEVAGPIPAQSVPPR
jgi:hypothetical protein